MELFKALLGVISVLLSITSSQLSDPVAFQKAQISVPSQSITIRQPVKQPVKQVVIPTPMNTAKGTITEQSRVIMEWYNVGESFNCCDNDGRTCICQQKELRDYTKPQKFAMSSIPYTVTRIEVFKEGCHDCVCQKKCVVESENSFYNPAIKGYSNVSVGECPDSCDATSEFSCGDNHINCSAKNYWQLNNGLKTMGIPEEGFKEADWYEYMQFDCVNGGCVQKIGKYRFCFDDGVCKESVSLPINF